MDIRQIHQDIVNRRKNGETYEAIHLIYPVGRTMIKYIEAHPGYKPSEKVAAALNLDPSRKQIYRQERQRILDEISRQFLGEKSWYKVGSDVIAHYAPMLAKS